MSVLPPDPRALPTFEIIRGEETMWRRDYTPADAHAAAFGGLPDEVLVGQPVRLLGTDGKCFIINDTDTERTDTALVHEVVGTVSPTIGGTNYEEVPLGISFTHYTKLLSGGGEPSATENDLITVVSGHFIARIKHATWFSATPTAGMGVQIINVGSVVGSEVSKFRGLDRDAQLLATPMGVSDAAGAEAIAGYINCVGKVLTVSGAYCEVEFTI